MAVCFSRWCCAPEVLDSSPPTRQFRFIRSFIRSFVRLFYSNVFYFTDILFVCLLLYHFLPFLNESKWRKIYQWPGRDQKVTEHLNFVSN